MTEQQFIDGLVISVAATFGVSLLFKLFRRHRPGADPAHANDQTNMVNWRDRTLEVKARVLPKYLWSTASIDVYLDDAAIIRTGGVMRLKGLNEVQFDEGGETHSVALSWRSPAQGMSFPYQLSVDGKIVLESEVRPPNWPMFLMPVFIGSALLVLIGLAVRH